MNPNALVRQEFNVRHAAGVTRYRVDRHHRDAGYYECVTVRCVEGTHTTIGAIQVFSAADIRQLIGDTLNTEGKLAREAMCR